MSIQQRYVCWRPKSETNLVENFPPLEHFVFSQGIVDIWSCTQHLECLDIRALGNVVNSHRIRSTIPRDMIVLFSIESLNIVFKQFLRFLITLEYDLGEI